MDGEETFWLNIWRAVIAGVILFALTIAGCDSYQTKLFIEKGYTRTVLPGSSAPTWIKEK